MPRYLKDKAGFYYAWTPSLEKQGMVEVDPSEVLGKAEETQTEDPQPVVRERRIYTKRGTKT